MRWENAEVYLFQNAIAQVLFLPVPKMQTHEITYEALLQFESKRGLNKEGSTNKH